MKNAVAKKNETYITVTPAGEHMERAAKVNYYHNVSKQGATLSIEAAFRCGMELFQAKLEHAGTFEQWIEENCEFGRAMAYRYLQLVQNAIGADDLPKLANGSEKQRKSAIAEIISDSDSKTVTEMFCEYGVLKKTKSNLGGFRQGAGRKRKADTAELAAAAEALANSAELAKTTIDGHLTDLYQAAIVQGGFGSLETADLKEVVTTLKNILAKAEGVLKSRKN